MAFTAADVASMETAIRELSTGKVSEVAINGRKWRAFELKDMIATLEYMKSDVNSAEYGGCSPIEFKGVTD